MSGLRGHARQRFRGAALGLALGLAAPLPGAAQMLDYGTLEQVFGESVTTSATGKPQRASEAPVNMEIITRDDIRRSGALTIPDVLQFMAGIDVRRYGVATAEVGIRGYNQPFNPRLLVLVDGRQVYQDDYSHVSWWALPVQLAEIRQIEVIKGPNSALYGFNAVSGVINIITANPLRERVNSVTAYGGTPDAAGLSAVASARLGERVGLRVSLGGFGARDASGARLVALDRAGRERPAGEAASMDLRVQLAPGVEAYLQGSLTDSRLAEKAFTGTYDTARLHTNSLRAGVDADTAIGLISLSAYRNGEHVTVGSPVINPDANWADQAVIVVQASDTVKLGSSHTLRAGLEYRNNALTSPGFVYGTIGYEVHAASLMWDWQITPALSLTNALRVDRLGLYYRGTAAAGSGLTRADYNRGRFTVPSFNSGLVWRVSEVDTLRLMVAQGMQAPSLVDFGVQTPAGTYGPFVVAGNPKLRPSVVRHVELDYDRELPRLAAAARLAVFAERSDDLMAQAYAATPVIGPAGLPVLLSANVGHSEAVGAELALKGHTASGWRWNLGYAFVATTDHTSLDQGPVATSAVDYAASVPRHVVTAGLGYSRGDWEADAVARWQSSFRDFGSNGVGFALVPVTVHNYVTVNARVGYRLTEHLTLALTGQQLNAANLTTVAGPLVERRLILSLTARF